MRAADGKEILLPLVDAFLVSIDVAGKRIVYDPPAGPARSRRRRRRMIFEVVTLFPEMFGSVLVGEPPRQGGGEGRARRCTSPIRARFTTDKHHSVDDTPYGGGAGMVMRPDPLVAAIEAVEAARGPAHKILLAPDGRAARRSRRCCAWRTQPRLLLVCGRYEGFDERVRRVLRRGAVDRRLRAHRRRAGRDGRRRRRRAPPARRARQRRLARSTSRSRRACSSIRSTRARP